MVFTGSKLDFEARNTTTERDITVMRYSILKAAIFGAFLSICLGNAFGSSLQSSERMFRDFETAFGSVKVRAAFSSPEVLEHAILKATESIASANSEVESSDVSQAQDPKHVGCTAYAFDLKGKDRGLGGAKNANAKEEGIKIIPILSSKEKNVQCFIFSNASSSVITENMREELLFSYPIPSALALHDGLYETLKKFQDGERERKREREKHNP